MGLLRGEEALGITTVYQVRVRIRVRIRVRVMVRFSVRVMVRARVIRARVMMDRQQHV